jgi:hypothetical protein
MSTEKAILSPCSTCKNKRDEPKDGKPACPRLVWQKYVKDLKDKGRDVPAALSPALLKGTEGTDQESSDALRNPVYSDDSHHILLWAAALADNKGVYNQQGDLLSPHILDPEFDTDFIQCRSLPYAVQDYEASYFMKGAYRENDTLEITEENRNQMSLSTGEVADFDPIRVAGTAQKVDFPFRFNRKPVAKDLAPRGT